MNGGTVLDMLERAGNGGVEYHTQMTEEHIRWLVDVARGCIGKMRDAGLSEQVARRNGHAERMSTALGRLLSWHTP